MKYTEGNWKATKKDGNYIIHTDQSNNGCLAIVGTGLYNSDPKLFNEAEANAKLIANSPNLLNAAILCESITDRCNNAMLPKHIQDLLKSINETLKQAINKATL